MQVLMYVPTFVKEHSTVKTFITFLKNIFDLLHEEVFTLKERHDLIIECIFWTASVSSYFGGNTA